MNIVKIRNISSKINKMRYPKWKYLIFIIRGCCKTKINMQCYESEKLDEHAIDRDFDDTTEAVPALHLLTY